MIFENMRSLDSGSEEIEIHSGDREWDLHNASELTEFSYDIKNLEFSLRWDYFDYDLSKVSYKLQLVFGSVYSLSISPRDPEMPIDEDLTLDFLCLDQDGSHLTVQIRGGSRILIHCERITFSAFEIPVQ